ncbi:MAG: lipocalin family protein [Cyclobacteriaceae bacterium]|nr:lipocalin family protein [Cyclobacteriaceae bacterium]
MKKYKKAIYIIAITGIALLSSCKGGGGNGDDPEMTIDDRLKGSWVMVSVTVDGADVTSDFTGLKVTFNSNGSNSGSGSYSHTGGNTPIYSTGNYNINGITGIVLSEGDGGVIEAAITLSNSDKTLMLSFNNPTTTFGGGRVTSVAGEYVIVLDKQ